jgi:polar amino acid transport system substrate-binding protein
MLCFYQGCIDKPMQYILVLCFVLSIFVSSATQAQRIRVVTEYLEPYQVQTEDGQVGGFMTDIVQAMFGLTGDQYKIEVMPWARAYETAINEPNVLIYSIVHTGARSQLFEWVGEVPSDNIYLWGLKRKFPEVMYTFNSLRYYNTAVIRSSNVEQYLKRHNFEMLTPVSYEDQLLKLLVRERIDLIVGTEETIWKRVENEGVELVSLVKVAELKDLNINVSIAFNKSSDPELVNRYKAAFLKLKSSGVLRRIKKDWYVKQHLKETTKVID